MDNNTKLVAKLGFNRVKVGESLIPYTNMHVGGNADLLVIAENSDQLVEAVLTARSLEIPILMIGNGANILVSDKGFRGLVIINHSKTYKFLPHDYLEAESGVNVVELISLARVRRLTGLERMMKVPATIGGAIYMNAGDTGRSEFFGDLVRSVRVLTPTGQIKTLQKEDCNFGYRSSRFQNSGEIILSCVIQLHTTTKDEIEEKAKDIIVRKINQPAGPSVGSTFKNPPGQFAGKLLEEAGVKGMQIGGAKVSEKHANFILNLGNATAENVKELIVQMKRKVKQRSGVDLEEEVRYLGDWDL